MLRKSISLFALLVSLHLWGQKLQIEYIAHASFLLTDGETTLLLDPFADTTWIGYYFPKDIHADVALITHPHYDHDGGRFRGMKPHWEEQLQIIEEPGEYTIGDFDVFGVIGKHSDPYGKEFGQKNTMWRIDFGGISLAHLGDNGPLTDKNYTELGSVDVLFVPIDSDYHILKASELETVLKRINPKIVIPMHYRIPELENPGFPKGGLGEIGPYLEDKRNVELLDNNRYDLTSSQLPDSQKILVFQHSKDVTKK